MSRQFRSDMDVDLVDSMGNDGSVIRSARVSTKGAKSLDMEASEVTIRGMINFLMKNRHGTPFEHNAMTFRISAPIFVFREFHRHRVGWSYNEESGRYTQLAPVFYKPASDRNLLQVGKAGAYTFVPGTEEQFDSVSESIDEASFQAYSAYEDMLDMGVAREVARMVLPVNIYSSMYATTNARALMHFLSLRTTAESTYPSFPQREIEMVAEKMETIFSQLFPVIHEAFVKNGRVAP